MTKFEVYITGDSDMKEVLEKFGVEVTEVESLEPTLICYCRETVAFFSIEQDNVASVVLVTDALVSILKEKNIRVDRIRIAMEFTKDNLGMHVSHILYAECRFIPYTNDYPLIRDTSTNTVEGIDREYVKNGLIDFWSMYQCEAFYCDQPELSLFVYDTIIDEDNSWMDGFDQYSSIIDGQDKVIEAWEAKYGEKTE